jgi:hypothetical protein
MTTAPKRRWFQFSLKGMLAVMTLACVGLGWLAYERNEVRKRHEAIAAIEKLGGEVIFDEEIPFRPKWLRPLLGDNSAGEVVRVVYPGQPVTDAGMANLKGLTKLRVLYLNNTQVTDTGLVYLQGLTEVELLVLDTQVTEQGASELQKALPSAKIVR